MASKPELDMSRLMVSAVKMHELYQTWQKAGFTKEESLYLLGQMILNAGQNPPPKNDDT